MARGAPDYSNVKAYGLLHRLDDLGEMAARLGSPISYSRSGYIVWYTNFEQGMQGYTFGIDGSPSAGSITTVRSIDGAFSIKLDPSSTPDSYVEWRGQAYYFPVGQLGFEVSICPDSTPFKIRMRLYTYTDTYTYQAVIDYLPSDGDWKVYKADGTWETVLESHKLQTGTTAWHPFKLVINDSTGNYVRFQIDGEVVDLSDYGMRKIEAAYLAQLEFGVTVYGSAALHAPAYFDRIIITQGEP